LVYYIKELSKILEKLGTITNAPPAKMCIACSRSLSFNSMKYIQLKFAGQNYSKQEEEFKNDVVQFKNSFEALSLYSKKSSW